MSKELFDVVFPILLWEEIAASASGRSSSSLWLKLNCRTRRLRRSTLGFSIFRLLDPESCDELGYLSVWSPLEEFPFEVPLSLWVVRLEMLLLRRSCKTAGEEGRLFSERGFSSAMSMLM